MKYLKLFNENLVNSEIHIVCKKYGIINYTINDDGLIDIIGNVNLHKKELTEIPLKFGKVTGRCWL